MGASRSRSVQSFRARPDHGQERVRKRPGNCCHRRKDSCSPLSPCDSGEKTATHCPDRRAATAILGIGTGGPSPKKRRPAPVPRPRIVVMDSLSGLRGGGLFSSPHTRLRSGTNRCVGPQTGAIWRTSIATFPQLSRRAPKKRAQSFVGDAGA